MGFREREREERENREVGGHVEEGERATMRVGWRGWEVRGSCMAYAQRANTCGFQGVIFDALQVLGRNFCD